MIKAVIFDFGNVLYSFRVMTFLEHLARRSTCTVPGLLKLMPDISRLAVAYETGLITSDQFFQQLTELARIRISRQEFIDSYCAIFTRIESTATLAVQLVDQAMMPISNRVIVDTTPDCDKNLILVNFKQVR